MHCRNRHDLCRQHSRVSAYKGVYVFGYFYLRLIACTVYMVINIYLETIKCTVYGKKKNVMLVLKRRYVPVCWRYCVSSAFLGRTSRLTLRSYEHRPYTCCILKAIHGFMSTVDPPPPVAFNILLQNSSPATVLRTIISSVSLTRGFTTVCFFFVCLT